MVPRMFDVQVPTKSYRDALLSENPQNQVLHVSDEKSDIRDRKPMPWATFLAYIIFQKDFEVKVGFLDFGFLCYFP